MPLHLVLNISSRWEKLCEIFPIIGGLNVISCCTIHNLFLDVQWMSAKASILGKLSCHCKTFQSYSLSFFHIITVFVSETCRSDRLDVLAVTEGWVYTGRWQTVTGLGGVRPPSSHRAMARKLVSVHSKHSHGMSRWVLLCNWPHT